MSSECGILKLAELLSLSQQSPLNRFTPKDSEIDSVIDFRFVFQSPHRELERGTLHPLLSPKKGKYGLRDYEKVFCVDYRSGNIYEKRGINKDVGCLIIVRPDQYVSQVLPLANFDLLTEFFEKILCPAS